MSKQENTNKTFAKENEVFIKACEKVGIKATSRQASKWRMGIGKAFKQS